MYVEIAEIDSNNRRSTTHSFREIVGLSHERGDADNSDRDRVHLTVENGTETVVGRGYGLEVVVAEQE